MQVPPPVFPGGLNGKECRVYDSYTNTRCHFKQAFLTLNVDLHPDETGLASVAVSLVRCLAGAVGVAFLQPLMEKVGPAWTFTFVGLLGCFSIPALLVLRVMGPGWRNCSMTKAGTPGSEGNDRRLFVENPGPGG